MRDAHQLKSSERAPLAIMMRGYPVQARVDALVASIRFESDGPGDALAVLLNVVRQLSFGLTRRQHRINVAAALRELSVGLFAIDVQNSRLKV